MLGLAWPWGAEGGGRAGSGANELTKELGTLPGARLVQLVSQQASLAHDLVRTQFAEEMRRRDCGE